MRAYAVAGIVIALGTFAAAQQPPQKPPATMEDMHRLHEDPKAYIAAMEDPERDAYQKPHEVVMALALRDGDRIADIGAGAGYFALRFAHHVGAAGRVYAVDISPDMIVHLNEKIRDAGLDNIRTVLARPDDPLLPASSVDRIFICDTWHHIENRGRYAEKLRTLLRPGGQVIVVDFQKKVLPVGPPDEMKLSRDDVIAEFRQYGFRLAKEETFLPYQYFLVFSPVAPK